MAREDDQQAIAAASKADNKLTPNEQANDTAQSDKKSDPTEIEPQTGPYEDNGFRFYKNTPERDNRYVNKSQDASEDADISPRETESASPYSSSSIGEGQGKEIGEYLNNGDASDDHYIANELGIKGFGKNHYFDKEFSEKVRDMAKDGLNEQELKEIREMAYTDKDGDGKADHIKDRDKDGGNYKGHVSLDDIKPPSVSDGQVASAEPTR